MIPFLHGSAFRDFSLHGFTEWMECSRLYDGGGQRDCHPANAPGIKGIALFGSAPADGGCVVITHFEYRHWPFNPGLAALESHSIYLRYYACSCVFSFCLGDHGLPLAPPQRWTS